MANADGGNKRGHVLDESDDDESVTTTVSETSGSGRLSEPSTITTTYTFGSVIVQGERNEADALKGNRGLLGGSSEEEPEVVAELPTKKRKASSSSHDDPGPKKASRQTDSGRDSQLQRDRAECALTTKYIAGEMFRKHCSDPRLDDPAKALGCVAIFLNTIEVSKWHWIAVKKKRSKLGHKWTNIIDLYFDGNRKGDSAVKWFNKHCEGKIDSKKGKPFVMLTEISKMDEVIGSMFTKRPHRPFGFAFLIKLAEARGSHAMNALDSTVWHEGYAVIMQNTNIWIQKLSLQDNVRLLYPLSLPIDVQETGETYALRQPAKDIYKRYYGSSGDDKPVIVHESSSANPTVKKKQMTLDQVGVGFSQFRALRPAPVASPASRRSCPSASATSLDERFSEPGSAVIYSGPLRLSGFPDSAAASSGPLTGSFAATPFPIQLHGVQIPGWHRYVPNDGDDIKWRKEAEELSHQEVKNVLQVLAATEVREKKCVQELMGILASKIDEVTKTAAQIQVYRKVEETLNENKRMSKKVGTILGEKNAAQAVNDIIKSFFDFLEGRVQNMSEAAASVAETYNPEVLQRLKSSTIVRPTTLVDDPLSPILKVPFPHSDDLQGGEVSSPGSFPTESTLPPTNLTLLDDCLPSSSQRSGTGTLVTIMKPRISDLPSNIYRMLEEPKLSAKQCEPSCAEKLSDEIPETSSGEGMGTPSGEAIETPSGNAMETLSGDAMETPSGDAMETPSGEATETPSDEATETPSGEAMQKPSGEATETSSGEAMETSSGEAMETPSGEAMVTLSGGCAEKKADGAPVEPPVQTDEERMEKEPADNELASKEGDAKSDEIGLNGNGAYQSGCEAQVSADEIDTAAEKFEDPALKPSGKETVSKSEELSEKTGGENALGS